MSITRWKINDFLFDKYVEVDLQVKTKYVEQKKNQLNDIIHHPFNFSL